MNGCNPTTNPPPGPWGLCLDNAVPGFYCCSGGFLGWSDVVAGMTIDFKGAVALTAAGTPSAPDVLIMAPDGSRTLIPVAANGAFEGKASFPTAGGYQIGLLYHGNPADMAGFDVGWKYVPGPGVATMASLFPNSANAWPAANHLFLAVPYGHPITDAVTIENLAGVPQPGAPAGFNGPVANQQGVATFKLTPDTAVVTEPAMLGPGLYAQTYVDITPAATGGLTGFPPPSAGSPAPIPSSVRTLSGNGVTYYDVADFLEKVEGYADTTGPLSWSSSGKTVSTGASLIDLSSGELDVEKNGQAPKTFGYVTPLVEDGQLYLSIPDLITLGNAIAWAAPDGHGGLYFSDGTIY